MDYKICNNPGLDIIIGSMYSGKSSELLRRLSTVAEVGMKALYINNKLDDRNPEDTFSSHNKHLKSKIISDLIKLISVNELSDVSNDDLKSANIIGVDESQFFKDLNLVKTWISKYKKRVIVVGLDGDYKRNKFGTVLDLIPYCDTVIKLTAYCTICAKSGVLVSALFTHRTNSCVDENNVINVGAHDKYQALCRSCYDSINKSDS